MSLKLGVRFDRVNYEHRYINLLAIAYKGYAPNGQFYDEKVNYLGLQLGFGF